jgi:hypothetical protein
MGHLVPLPPWASREDIERRMRYHMRLQLLLGACIGAAGLAVFCLLVIL